MLAKALVIRLISVSMALVGSQSFASGEISQVTVEGLHLVKDTELALVYAEPGVDLRQYHRINLAPAYIAFKKNWKRNQNQTDPHKIESSDMDKMKVELAELFRVVFSETLEQGGYELVTERAEDVLLIRPAIINLDVISPDTTMSTAANVHSYAETVGEMTLYLELYDSLTDDIIAKALDPKEDRRTGYFLWQNRVTNRAAANRILKVWADVLKQGLDEASAVNGN